MRGFPLPTTYGFFGVQFADISFAEQAAYNTVMSGHPP
jgi:hypothetical protein